MISRVSSYTLSILLANTNYHGLKTSYQLPPEHSQRKLCCKLRFSTYTAYRIYCTYIVQRPQARDKALQFVTTTPWLRICRGALRLQGSFKIICQYLRIYHGINRGKRRRGETCVACGTRRGCYIVHTVRVCRSLPFDKENAHSARHRH